MRTKLKVLPFCVALSASLRMTEPSHSQGLIMTEIDATGRVEWIEFYNAGGTPEDLHSYVLRKESVDGKEESTRLPEGFSMPPGGFFVVCVESRGAGEDVRCEEVWCTPGACLPFDLDGDGGVLSLFWVPPCRTDLETELESVRYPPAYGGHPYGRLEPDSPWFYLNAPTPGEANAPPYLPDTKVILNEVSTESPPSSADCSLSPLCPDWVELRSVSDAPVDLTGFRLTSRGDSFTFPPGTVVLPGMFLVVVCGDMNLAVASCPLFGPSGFRLKASGEGLVLQTPPTPQNERGELWDAVSVPALEPGEYYARSPDAPGIGPWKIVTTATPCRPNELPPSGGLPPHCEVIDRFPLRVLPGDPVEIYAEVTDEDGDLLLDEVTLSWQERGGGPVETVRMLPAKRVTCERLPEKGILRGVIPPLGSTATISYEVRARDKEGNITTSRTHEFRVQPRELVLALGRHLLRINEIAANGSAPEGDWVEIYNSSDDFVPLDDMFLTDDVFGLERRRIPANATVEPKGFYLVRFDQSSNPDPEEPSFPFALEKCRDEVILFESDGLTVVDAVMFHEEKRLTTLGRFPDGGDLLTIMNPTPKEPNELVTCLEFRATGRGAKPLSINEVMADNWSFEDAGEESGDWLEIYNPELDDVDLEGWVLREDASICFEVEDRDRDELAEPWVFPAGTRVPGGPEGGYLVVWCDNDTCENTPENSEIHTNFEINRKRAYIELVDPGGTVVDTVALRFQARDVSAGRYPDGAGRAYLLTPSPGEANPPPGAQPGVEVEPCSAIEARLELPPNPSCGAFRRGDANGDCAVDITDAVATLNWLFLGGRKLACMDAADTDDTGNVDLSDAVYVLTHLFLGGRPPPPPFNGMGYDLTWDGLLECDEIEC